MYLNCHSYHSLNFGTLSVPKLVKLAHLYKIECLALTDINCVSGVFDFVKECKKFSITPLVGIDFRLNDRHLYIGLARNIHGFHELNSFLSEYNLQKKDLPARPPFLPNVFFIFPENNVPVDLHENEYIGILPTRVNKLFRSPLLKYSNKLVIKSPVSIHSKKDFELHLHLQAIMQNTLLSKVDTEHAAANWHRFLPGGKLAEVFGQYPFILQNTELLMSLCNFEFDFSSVKNMHIFGKTIEDDISLLRQLALDGLQYRYPNPNADAVNRLNKELDTIIQLGFTAYFLISWDIIRFSMSKGIYHVGRGSGANSLVAYSLRITDVDPIELNLYFERFINPFRTNLPDFDIDFSWKDRNAIYDYIFEKYGKTHAALLGTTTTFQYRSSIRELSKVYGLPKEETDVWIKSRNSDSAGAAISNAIVEYATMLVDFPNGRSIHAGGVLISHLPITYFSALDLPPKDYPVVQFDMYVAEDINFEKLDILSQRGLGHIHDAVGIVRENRNIEIDIHQVEAFKTDMGVCRQLKSGDTIGCFYIESPAMRGLLKKLKCETYLALVAASSIIRPGVAKSGMMREFIFRFNNPDKYTYLHPVMQEHLSETFGIMVYQEDVLRICHHYAGLDLASADILRRAMSGKSRRKEEFERIVSLFFSNSTQRGHPQEVTDELWRQIESFAGYSFSKAHSASYAVESYQSLYLKTYYPLEFLVAVINNFGGFYQRWVYFRQLVREGALLELPCVNFSTYLTRISDTIVYIGFIHVQNLESKFVDRIMEERERNGMYTSLGNFIDRVHPPKEQLIILIRLGALRFTNLNKPVLLWQCHMLLTKSAAEDQISNVFDVAPQLGSLPQLTNTPVEDAYDELEILGFAVTLSHFDLLRTRFRGEIMADDLPNNIGKTVKMVGHLVHVKKVITVHKELMYFGTFFDLYNHFFDTVHFSQVHKMYPLHGDGIYLLEGKVIDEFGFCSLEVLKVAMLEIVPDPKSG